MLHYKRRKRAKNKFWLVRGIHRFTWHNKTYKYVIENYLSTKHLIKEDAEIWVKNNLTDPFEAKVKAGIQEVKKVLTVKEMYEYKQSTDKPFTSKYCLLLDRIMNLKVQEGISAGEFAITKVTNDFIREIADKIYPMDKYKVWIKEKKEFVQKTLEQIGYRELNQVWIHPNDCTGTYYMAKSSTWKRNFLKALQVKSDKMKNATLQEVFNLRKFRSSKLNSKNQVISVLGSLVHLAHYKDNISWIRISKYSLFESPPITFTEDECQRFIDNATLVDTKRLFLFCLYTGARLNEALKQRWDMIDLENNSISIFEEKDLAYRVITIHPILKQMLEEINNKDGRLFIWETEDTLKNTHQGLYNNWHWTLDKAGITHDKIVHQCRATFITWNRKYNNFDKIGLKRLSGHKSDASIDHYADVLPEEITSAINNLPSLSIN